jgi:hypothetical protein
LLKDDHEIRENRLEDEPGSKIISIEFSSGMLDRAPVILDMRLLRNTGELLRPHTFSYRDAAIAILPHWHRKGGPRPALNLHESWFIPVRFRVASEKSLTVPRHDEIRRGTLMKTIEETGLAKEQFLDLL